MANHAITAAIGGGPQLDRAELSRLRIVPADAHPPAQVLVWDMPMSPDQSPIVSSRTRILPLAEEARIDALPATAGGLFSRQESPEALGVAIREVARGQQYISPCLALAVLQKRPSTSSLTQSQQSVIESLTGREREILILFAQGLSNKTIAARLYLSVRRVEGQLGNMYSRLGVHSRTEAMLIAFEIR
jgi:DNA-binding CsgD family transcriptional regulator